MLNVAHTWLSSQNNCCDKLVKHAHILLSVLIISVCLSVCHLKNQNRSLHKRKKDQFKKGIPLNPVFCCCFFYHVFFLSVFFFLTLCSQDTLSLVSTDPSEINRLQQELASAETARTALAESVTTLEQERQRAEQSVWMTQGELNALQEQLKSSAMKLQELQQQYSALEQR